MCLPLLARRRCCICNVYHHIDHKLRHSSGLQSIDATQAMLRSKINRHLRGFGCLALRNATEGPVLAVQKSEAISPHIPKDALQSWLPSRRYQSLPARRSTQYQHFKGRKPWWQSATGMKWLGIAGGAGGVYYIAHIETVPYSGRRHAVLVSPATEMALGTSTFQQFKQEAEANGTLLPARHPASRLVSKIGMRIAGVAQTDNHGQPIKHMKGLDWEFAIINEPTVNAFVVPGGKVVFYTGLLRLLESEDEIAAILGHEAAHVVSRHIGEKLSSTIVFTFLQLAAGLVLGVHIPADIAQLAVFLPNSRKVETEADAVGIQLAAKACFKPSGAVGAFEKLAAAEKREGVKIPQLLRTHPLSESRIKAIKHNLPKAEQEYELAGCRAPKSFFDVLGPA